MDRISIQVYLPWQVELLISHSFSLFFIVFLVGGFTSSAQQNEIGSSINPVGSGARAMGLGNAFIAVADDATAASWNPAGLIQLQAPEFSLAVEAHKRKGKISSPSNPENSSIHSLQLEDLNYASLVYPFYFQTSMVFSLNYLKVYRFDKSFSFPVSRFVPGTTLFNEQFDFQFDQDGEFSVLAPAYAVFINSKLSLGITVNIWNHALTDSSLYEKRQSSIGTVTSTTDPEFPVLSTSTWTEDRFVVDEGYSLVIGGLFRINDHWNAGVVVKPQFELELEHTSRRSESTLRPERKEFAELEFPLILGIGFTWRPMDEWTLSSDMTWTDWSKFLFSENGARTNPISGDLSTDSKLDDTYTVRLGCEYLIIRDSHLISLRGGLGYDPSPAVADEDKFYTASLGMGLQFGSFNFDAAWEFRWGNNVNSDTFRGITASQDIRQHRVLTSFIYYF